ncbi:MAG: bifunctional metallophosphatase/5'-nucleotidase, partial [Oscillospiraceae bacterium]|nr:bifunctional metallophosphatase/5'-nucleotidase [Oscillospiraceae bacterium]
TEGSANMFVSFDVFAINDLHGRLTDSDTQPGVDELSRYIADVRSQGNVILLATGDMWQGTAEGGLTQGQLITDWMNYMAFDAMTLGGHEYDWGEAGIRANQTQAEFPFLAINIYNHSTGKQADYCQSSLLLEMDGAQVGIIGAIGNCYNAISAGQTQDVYFKTGDELTALVKAEAESLRQQGADFIIYTLHDGFTENFDGVNPIAVEDKDIADYYDSVLSDGSVDLVFEADTHYCYVLTDEQGVYHLQAGGNNSGISHARVVLDLVHGESWVMNAEVLPSSQYSYLEKDPMVNTLPEKYEDILAPANRIVGNNAQYQNSAALCRLVAELYCQVGLDTWGQEYDIVLGGGYLSCRSPGYLPAGQVSYSQLQSLFPFDNKIQLCSIRGRDLISRFLETENDAYYIHITEYGDSILHTIDPDGIYYLITDSYTSDYSYNNLTVVETYRDTVFARDLLAEQFAS